MVQSDRPRPSCGVGALLSGHLLAADLTVARGTQIFINQGIQYIVYMVGGVERCTSAYLFPAWAHARPHVLCENGWG